MILSFFITTRIFDLKLAFPNYSSIFSVKCSKDSLVPNIPISVIKILKTFLPLSSAECIVDFSSFAQKIL